MSSDEQTQISNEGQSKKTIEMTDANEDNDREEEKDDLYNALAPQQPVAEQIEKVVSMVADLPETKINDNDNDDKNKCKNDVRSSIYLKSTLKRDQRAWIDPWEAAVQDTFYHKQIDTLRPNFNIVKSTIRDVESLANIFSDPPPVEVDYEQVAADEPNPDDLEAEAEDEALRKKPSKKFGPWDGVMASCLLNIFGVIMFLRLGFVVGQAGIIQGIIIICISSVVVMLTALSMSAICTNGTILAGGAYYIISRALGPSIGGAIGILFSIGNMVACSMYLIGFAETLVTNLKKDADFQIFDDPVMDVRIWSNVVLCLVLFLAIIGLKYVIKAQLGLLAYIVIAIILFFVGSFYQQVYNDEGILVITPKGWTNGNFKENLSSGYEGGYDFWATLAIFFPAVTGIMAGANISGDLRNPSSDIPKGTLTAIIISTIVYMIMAIFVGAVTVRYELITNDLVMALICVHEYIILIAIYAATLSSAIASLVGAPRILQAVANDNLFPFKCLSYFAKGNSEGNPIRGYFLSFGVTFCCNLIGELNMIAPLISEFFMLTYLLINLACFALEISKSPGWRPSFKYFNKYTSGLGALFCCVIMFLLNWIYALIACILALLLWLYVTWKDPDVNWGSATEARKYYRAYKAILKLKKSKQHVKNWRPGLLVLVKDPVKKAEIMLFAKTLKKGHGPIFYSTVYTGDRRTNIRKFQENNTNVLGYLPSTAPKKCKGFYECTLADNLRDGVQKLIELVGLGSLRPNTLIIGYKTKWITDTDDVINEYVQILRDTLVMGLGVMIVVGFKQINWLEDEYEPPHLNDQLTDETKDSKKEQVYREELSINVWWMIDDGGLCMLMPYIMKLHKFWEKCELRMLMVSDENSIDAGGLANMQKLIHQFRLPYKKPIFVSAKAEPKQETIDKFEMLCGQKIDEISRTKVIKKWLILSELLVEYSTKCSGLNVVTLPIPSKSMTPKTYMALLHMLSDQKWLPPTIIMRGNGESTLTFYSE